MPTGLMETSAAISVAVSAELVFAIIAAFCSSPQTAELNASKRAPTLMKWVKLGVATSILFTAVLVILDGKRWPPLLGAGMAMLILWLAYQYALRCGLESTEQGTESY